MKITATVASTLIFAANASARLFPKHVVTEVLDAGVGTRKTLDEHSCQEEIDTLEEIIGDTPGPENFGDVCKLKKNGKVAVCDYSLFDSSEFERACNDNGGKIIDYKLENCRKREYSEEYTFEKLVVKNLLACIGMSCEKEAVLTMMKNNDRLDGRHCPKEDKNAKFMLMFDEEKGKAVMRSCKKLAKKKKWIRNEICFGSRFQVYDDGHLPASQVCGKTCKRNLDLDEDLCIEETKKAIFVTHSEDGKEMLQTCGWLQKQDEMTRMEICDSAIMIRPSENKYGSALDICVRTCNSC